MNQDTRPQASWRQQVDNLLQHEAVSAGVTVEFQITSDRTLANARLRASRRHAPLHRVNVTPLLTSRNGDAVSVMYIVHGLPDHIRHYLNAVEEDLDNPGLRGRL